MQPFQTPQSAASQASSLLAQRYAMHGSAAFNMQLHAALLQITEEVRQLLGSNLVALLLGGGYGRGEGAVVCVDGIEQLYNDLDFTLVVHRKTAVPSADLAALSSRHAQQLGIHVDFSRPLTCHDIRRWPCWLMWWDLVRGHVVLDGPATILHENAPTHLQLPLALIEGTRLLLNRGAGLLWAMRVARGHAPAPDTDFIRRNAYKCLLALGDALLIAHRQYTVQYRGRDTVFAALATTVAAVGDFALTTRYREALQFKFQPHTVVQAQPNTVQLQDLAGQWGAVLLYLEQLRTGRTWDSLDAYVQWPDLREPEQHTFSQLPRNMLRNLQSGTCGWRYPRERLYRQLPGLLGITSQHVRYWSAASSHFLAVWQQCN